MRREDSRASRLVDQPGATSEHVAMQSEGLGQLPLSNDTAQGRLIHRRVEMLIKR